MKKHTFLLLILGAMALCSCGKKTLIDETRTFENDTWLRFTPESYQVEAPNTEDCYNFLVSLTVDTTRYREAAVPITMEIESPQGEKRTLFSTMIFRNAEGKTVAQANPDGTLTATQNVRQFYFFNTTGQHKITIGQRTSKYEIRGMKALHFTIQKAKLEYPE